MSRSYVYINFPLPLRVVAAADIAFFAWRCRKAEGKAVDLFLKKQKQNKTVTQMTTAAYTPCTNCQGCMLLKTNLLARFHLLLWRLLDTVVTII